MPGIALLSQIADGAIGGRIQGAASLPCHSNRVTLTDEGFGTGREAVIRRFASPVAGKRVPATEKKKKNRRREMRKEMRKEEKKR